MLKAGRAYHKYKAKRNSWPKVGFSRVFCWSLRLVCVGGGGNTLISCDMKAPHGGHVAHANWRRVKITN